jgi:hypothetical protein
MSHVGFQTLAATEHQKRCTSPVNIDDSCGVPDPSTATEHQKWYTNPVLINVSCGVQNPIHSRLVDRRLAEAYIAERTHGPPSGTNASPEGSPTGSFSEPRNWVGNPGMHGVGAIAEGSAGIRGPPSGTTASPEGPPTGSFFEPGNWVVDLRMHGSPTGTIAERMRGAGAIAEGSAGMRGPPSGTTASPEGPPPGSFSEPWNSVGDPRMHGSS